MKLLPPMFHAKHLSVLLLLLFLFSNLFSQRRIKTTSDRATATDVRIFRNTTPLKRAIINKEILVNPDLYKVFKVNTTTDTVWSLAPYLKSKENCDYEKSIDSNGCILVKYKDGLIKKICDGSVTEVITPDGKKHVGRNWTIKMYVMKLPAPPNPTEAETSFKWLNGYNNGLIEDIKTALGNNKDLINQYLLKETQKCNSSVYKQIEYRTIFLQEFLKAK